MRDKNLLKDAYTDISHWEQKKLHDAKKKPLTKPFMKVYVFLGTPKKSTVQVMIAWWRQSVGIEQNEFRCKINYDLWRENKQEPFTKDSIFFFNKLKKL